MRVRFAVAAAIAIATGNGINALVAAGRGASVAQQLPVVEDEEPVECVMGEEPRMYCQARMDILVG